MHQDCLGRAISRQAIKAGQTVKGKKEYSVFFVVFALEVYRMPPLYLELLPWFDIAPSSF
jgi:hypothetical protein